MTVTSKEDAVRSVAMDYVEGWFEGDMGRMQRALHPELVKRCRGIEGDDPDALETLSAREMIDATADGEGRREDAADRRIEIRIDHLSGGIAGRAVLLPLPCRSAAPDRHAGRMEDRQRGVASALKAGVPPSPWSGQTRAGYPDQPTAHT
jgi:hypothetical protein